jgi:inner membrane protein
MPLAVGHAILGVSIVTTMRFGSPYGQSRKVMALGALLAVCPDFDVLLLWGWGGNDWHRGFSHSLAFAVAIGLFAWACMAVYKVREAIMYISAVLSHTLMDGFFSKDRDGIAFLWPFSAERYSMSILPYFEFPWNPRYDSMLNFLKYFIEYNLIEMVVFSPLLVLCYRNWQADRRNKTGISKL